MSNTPFHLAFPVHDLAATRAFYEGLLGCRVGRTSNRWIDFDFWGHQITAHLEEKKIQKAAHNPVDGKQVPIRHFGAILEWNEWHSLADKLKAVGTDFLIEPYVRFKGEAGEQATLFFLDPSGNALEFKSFKDREMVFAVDG